MGGRNRFVRHSNVNYGDSIIKLTPSELIKNKYGKSQVREHFGVIKEDGQIDKKTPRVQIMPNYSQAQRKY